MPDPDFTPPQTRAECVAWLRARAAYQRRTAKDLRAQQLWDDAESWASDCAALETAAAALERGEQP